MPTATNTIEALATQEYKYGFVTEVETESVPKGLNEDVIRLISPKKNEPDWMLEQAQALRPALAIFDLNSQRLQPLSTLAGLKADASLAGIRTIGFVSHVHVALIEAARSAGMDEVMVRSAFVAKLGDIVGNA